MANKVRKRNLQKEIKYNIIWDCLLLLACSFAISLFSESISKVGDRNIVVLGSFHVVFTVFLMTAFEKYKPGISGLWEKNVIIILSSIMSFFLLSLANLVLFMSFELFKIQSMTVVCSVLLLVLENAVLNAYFENTKRFRKAKLLIVDNKDKNFSRMKRIKYGVTNLYDAWYEHIDESGEEYMEKFVNEKFPEFDSICILDGLSDGEYNIAVKKAMQLNKELFVVPKIIDVGKCGAHLVRFDDVLTLYIPEHSLSRPESAVKRIVDIVFSGLGIVVAAIPMLLIALAIKLTSEGPVFFKQTRYTKDKKTFEIYKFRTMIPDAENLSGPVFAQKNDTRITKVGKILRSCRLDELPQLINIFKGDMSVVGPRPERPVFVEQFEKEIENYDYRFKVKAGLTALSHVYGRYSTYIHDRTCYDLYYISNYSIILDFQILLLTAKTMFLKSAAEGEDEYKTKTIARDNKEVMVNEKQ